MSSIDNRIVQMQFENSQFEKGVDQSLKSLDNLKKGLDLKDAGKSLDSLQKAGNSFSLAKMANGIDTISDKFTTMGIIGKRILENLADSAYKFGVNFVKSVSVDQISAGWSKYEQKTKAVQQIVNATGLSIKDVDKELEKLIWFSDETSYSFTDMVSNIGKFTSMNIPLDKSVTAMQGISTWAALSGAGIQEANRAMYNLSQAIGLGSVKMQDWKSIALANMATAEFKQTAIDTAVAMGKLKKGAVDVSKFESTLSKGWFTSDVLLEVLGKYGQIAGEVYQVAEENNISAAQAMELMGDKMNTLGGKAFKAAQEARTFTDAIEAAKDAVSSNWMSIFENIFGNFEEAKVLWTDFANYLWDIFALPLSNLNDAFSEWKELGGRTKLIEGLYDIFDSLKYIIDAVSAALAEIFPPITAENLMTMSEAVADFGSNLKDLLHITEAEGKVKYNVDDKIARIMKENSFATNEYSDAVKELQDELVYLGLLDEKYADGFFNLATKKSVKDWQDGISGVTKEVEKLDNTFKFGDRGKEVEEFQKKLKELGHNPGDIDGIYGKKTKKAYEDYLKSLEEVGDKKRELKRKDKGDDVKELQEMLNQSGLVDKIKADGIFGPETEKALKAYQKAKGLTESGILDKETAEALYGKDVKSRIRETVQSWTTYSNALQRLKNIAKGAFAGFDILRQVLGFLAKAGLKIVGVFRPVGDMLLKMGDAASRFLVAFDERLKNSKKFQEWLDKLDSLLGPVKDKISQLCQSFLDLIGIGGDLDDIDFNVVVDNFINAFKNFFGIGNGIDAALDGIDGKSIIEKLKNKLVEIYTSVRDWIVNLFSGKNNLAGGNLDGLKIEGHQIAIAALSLLTVLLTKNVIGIFSNINGGLKYIRKSLKRVSDILGNIKQSTKAKAWESTAKTILMFAGAIAILAGSVYILSRLKWPDLAKGLLGLIVIVGLLVGSMIALDKLLSKKGPEKLAKIAELIMPLATAIGALAAVALIFTNMSFGSMAQGLLGVAALLAICIGALKLLDKSKVNIKDVSGTIGLLGSLGATLGAFASVVARLGSYDTGTLVKGFAGLIVLLFVIQKFIKSLNGIKVDWSAVAGILSVALAIDLIIAGFAFMILAMKIFKPGDIIKGIAGMIVVVLSMVGLMKAISAVHPDTKAVMALLPMAIALDLVIAGFIAMVLLMKMAKPGDIAKAIIGMGAIMLAMVGIMKLVEKVHPNLKAVLSLLPVAMSIAMMVGAFVVLALAMKFLTAGDIAKAILSMGTIVLAIAALMKLIEKIRPSIRAVLALIPIAAALALTIGGFVLLAIVMKHVDPGTLAKTIIAFAAVIGGLALVMLALSKIPVGSKASIQMLIASVAMAIAMGTFALALNAIKDVDTGKIVAFALGLAAVMLAFGYFASVATIIPVMGFVKAAAGLLILAAAITVIIFAVNAILHIPGVSKFLASGAAKIGEIIGSFTGAMKAADMKAFSKGMEGFKDVSDADEDSVNNAIKCAQLFADFSNGLPKKSFGKRLGDWFVGSEMKHFASDMESFAKGFNAFAEQMKDLVIDSGLKQKVNSALAIANVMKRFQDGLPQIDSEAKIKAYTMGLSPMAAFMQDAGGFANSFNAVADEIMAIEIPKGFANKVKSAVNAMNPLKKFAEGLPEINTWSGLVARILGLSPMQMFNEDNLAFASGFDAFVTAFTNVPEPPKGFEAKVKNATKILGYIVQFDTDLPEYTAIEKITNWIGLDIWNDMQMFMWGDLRYFADGLNAFQIAMSGISLSDITDLEPKVSHAVKVLKAIAAFAKDDLPDYSFLEKATGVIGILIGQRTDMEIFARKDISAFVSGINAFKDGMSEITFTTSEGEESLESKANSAVAVLKAIAAFAADDVPKYTGGIKNKLLGWLLSTDLQVFVDHDVNAFIKGITAFRDGFNDITFTADANGETLQSKATKTVYIMKAISSFAKNDLPPYTPIKKNILTAWLTSTDLQVFVDNDLNKFIEGAQAFNNGFSSIKFTEDENGETLESKATSFVTILKAISSFAKNDLPPYTPIKKNILTAWLTSTDLQVFVDNDLNKFIEGAQAFSNGFSSIKFTEDENGETLESKATSFITILKAISSFASNDIPEYKPIEKNKLTSWLTSSDLDVFVDNEVAPFVAAAEAFTGAFDGITFKEDENGETLTQKTTDFISLLNAISTFANSEIPEYKPIEKNKLTSWLTSTDLEAFVDKDLSSFTRGVNGFVTAMTGIKLKDENGGELKQTTIDAVEVMGVVASFISDLSFLTFDKEPGPILALFTKKTGQKTVFDSMGEIATSMSKASENFKDINASGVADNIKAAADAALAIALLLKTIGDTEDDWNLSTAYSRFGDIVNYWLTGDTGLVYFIDKFNEGLADKNIDLTAVTSVMTAFSQLATLLSGAGDVKISTDNFLGDLDATAVAEKLSTFTSSLTTSLSDSTTAITDQAQTFNDAGNSLASAVSAGMSSSSVDTSGLTSAVSQCAIDLAKYSSSFETVGNSFTLGLARGMNKSRDVALAVAAGVARAMLQAAKDALNINSPSREAAKLGSGFDEGLAKGARDSLGLVAKSSEGAATAMLDTAKGSLASLSSILADDIDDTPVVRPVVDLTSAREAASSIGGLFHNPSFGVDTTANLAKQASASNSARMSAKQAAATQSSASSVSSTNSAVNLSGNNFYIRSEQDVQSLASEIATLSKQQQRSYGAVL